jgi:hypothetical protein
VDAQTTFMSGPLNAAQRGVLNFHVIRKHCVVKTDKKQSVAAGSRLSFTQESFLLLRRIPFKRQQELHREKSSVPAGL